MFKRDGMSKSEWKKRTDELDKGMWEIILKDERKNVQLWHDDSEDKHKSTIKSKNKHKPNTSNKHNTKKQFVTTSISTNQRNHKNKSRDQQSQSQQPTQKKSTQQRQQQFPHNLLEF